MRYFEKLSMNKDNKKVTGLAVGAGLVTLGDGALRMNEMGKAKDAAEAANRGRWFKDAVGNTARKASNTIRRDGASILKDIK